MKEISAQETYELMQQDPSYVYLDVRSQPEFEQGHPINSINIPILHFDPRMGMYPNEDFTRVVLANLSKDAKLVIGCKTGVRSAQACEILNQLGYRDVINVRGGFHAATDMFGRVIEPGWSLLNLPVCRNCGPEVKYETLAAKAENP